MADIYFERLTELRHLMSERGWDVLIISGSDPHGSEYVADRWKGVRWLSGFSGEGDIAVTSDHAGLWTDTRYFISADKELRNTGFELHKMGVPKQVSMSEWLANHFADDRNRRVVVCVDGISLSAESVKKLKDAFRDAGFDSDCCESGLQIVSMPDVLDYVWKDRMPLPVSTIIALPDDLTGETVSSKLAWIRNFIKEKNCGSILISALDEVAWMLNIRGFDIEYNPVVISYLLITEYEAKWYVRKNTYEKPDGDTSDSFAEVRRNGVEILPYDDVEIGLCNALLDYRKPVYADCRTLNYNLYRIICNTSGDGESMVVFGKSPVCERKAVKNKVETDGMRMAHLEDGLVMERFLFWVEKQVEFGDGINEWAASCKLFELRSEADGFMGNSFATISAYADHAALPHYVTPEFGSSILDNCGLYLCDSGAHYAFGTTDITRTVPLGRCTDLEIEDYTLALKGHIDLAMAVFPLGTAGCHLDILARKPLWKNKRDYGHGTGHGVGCFLNVHEGPQSFSQNMNDQRILPGMITSDEPGIYRKGMHGIRHESLLLCKKAGTNDFGSWLEFEPLTLCHIDTSIVDTSLLSDDELEWLNEYNATVFDKLSNRLPKDVARWLRFKTMPLKK